MNDNNVNRNNNMNTNNGNINNGNINKIELIDLKKMEYDKALAIQYALFDKRSKGLIGDTILFVEHPPVITLGRRGKRTNIILGDDDLKKNNVQVHEISRGGDVTYHGPGQLVGYFIFDLKSRRCDIKKFVYDIEEAFIRLLGRLYNIKAEREEKKYTGVWVGNRKITAIGLAVKHYVTMHGFAFNVNTNLEHFNWIVPCGITDRGVTSLAALIGNEIDVDKIKIELISEFSRVFNTEIRHVSNFKSLIL